MKINLKGRKIHKMRQMKIINESFDCYQHKKKINTIKKASNVKKKKRKC